MWAEQVFISKTRAKKLLENKLPQYQAMDCLILGNTLVMLIE